MELGANKKIIIISVILLILLIVSGYFNYQYYKLYKSTNAVQNASNFSARVLSVGDKSLTVDNGLNKSTTININNNTVFYKATFTAQGVQNENASLSDISAGMTVNVSLNAKDSKLADRIDIMVQNVLNGNVKSINDNELEIELNGEVSKIKLTSDTKYYLQKPVEFNAATNTSPVDSGLSESSKDQIKTGGQVIVFLTGTINEGNFQANQVIAVEAN